MTDYRIALRLDDPAGAPDSQLDDVVIRDVPLFRAEMMDNRTLWMQCHLDGDRYVTFYVRAEQRRPGGLFLSFRCTDMPAPGPGITYEEARNG